MATHEIKVGCIVALKSHPYFQDLTNIIVAGDPLAISPLMIVVEILKDSRKTHDEHHGTELTNPNTPQCKCVWYTHKNGSFEEQWISGKLLKIIDTNVDTIKIEKPRDMAGKLVVLRTIDIEMGKVKSSFSLDYTDEETSSPKTNHSPILHYVSPVMQIVEVRKNENKEPKYDIKTGDPKRFFSEYSVKCKWYNNSTDKLSEKFIPIEALTILPEIDNKILESIQSDIDKNSPIFYKLDNTIIRPRKILYKSGRYYLRAYDYILNKYTECSITELFTIDEHAIISREPQQSSITNNDLRITNIKSLIRAAIENHNYIKIKYKDINERITTRTLSQCSIDGDYVTGYCHLRNDIRTFNISNVQYIQQLNITYTQE